MDMNANTSMHFFSISSSGHGYNRQKISNDIGKILHLESRSKVPRTNKGRILVNILSLDIVNGIFMGTNSNLVIFFIPNYSDLLML